MMPAIGSSITSPTTKISSGLNCCNGGTLCNPRGSLRQLKLWRRVCTTPQRPGPASPVTASAARQPQQTCWHRGIRLAGSPNCDARSSRGLHVSITLHIYCSFSVPLAINGLTRLYPLRRHSWQVGKSRIPVLRDTRSSEATLRRWAVRLVCSVIARIRHRTPAPPATIITSTRTG